MPTKKAKKDQKRIQEQKKKMKRSAAKAKDKDKNNQNGILNVGTSADQDPLMAAFVDACNTTQVITVEEVVLAGSDLPSFEASQEVIQEVTTVTVPVVAVAEAEEEEPEIVCLTQQSTDLANGNAEDVEDMPVAMEIDELSDEDKGEDEESISIPAKIEETLTISHTDTLDTKTIEPQELIQIMSESVQRNTILKNGNGFVLDKLRDGRNFFKKWSAPDDRNIEVYTQRESTHMSSFSLAQDNQDLIGLVDFIGDVECFKKLFRASTNSQAMSFLVHRVGESILVDDLDLMSVLWNNAKTIGFQHNTDIVKMVLHCIPENERQSASFGWRSDESRENKNGMHHLFRACMEGQLLEYKEGEVAAKKLKRGKSRSKPNGSESPTLKGSDFKFLNTNLWTFGKRMFLIGSNVPTFLFSSDSIDDEPFINCMTTLGINSPEITGSRLTKWNGIDCWFNNKSIGADQTYLCHHNDCILLESEVIKTDEIPERAKFNERKLLESYRKLMDGIYDGAGTTGHSYWLYRVPGTEFLRIYDVTNLFRNSDAGNGYWSFEDVDEFLLAFSLKRAEIFAMSRQPNGHTAQQTTIENIAAAIKKPPFQNATIQNHENLNSVLRDNHSNSRRPKEVKGSESFPKLYESCAENYKELDIYTGVLSEVKVKSGLEELPDLKTQEKENAGMLGLEVTLDLKEQKGVGITNRDKTGLESKTPKEKLFRLVNDTGTTLVTGGKSWLEAATGLKTQNKCTSTGTTSVEKPKTVEGNQGLGKDAGTQLSSGRGGGGSGGPVVVDNTNTKTAKELGNGDGHSGGRGNGRGRGGGSKYSNRRPRR